MKQTAVEWLATQLGIEHRKTLINQAKQMEKQQVIEEKNNGWIKIHAVVDLPKENGYFLCLFKDGDIIPHHFSINSEFDKELFLQEFTHYQPIIKPQPPIV